MIDVRRYRGLAIVSAGLLCAFVLVNAALVLALGVEPAMFDHPDRQIAWSQLERMGEVVAGIELDVCRDGADSQRPFGVVVGQSTTLRGIDPSILEQQVQPMMPWLLVNGFGSSFVKLDYYAQTLLASKLRPRTIVLGLHETMLAGQARGNALAEDEAGAVETDEGPETGWRLRRRIKQMIWVRKQRADISHVMNMWLFECRLKLHGAIGSGAAGLFTPKHSPWSPPQRDALPDRRPKAFLRRQVNGWRDFGWYEPASYTTGGRQAEAFRALIAGCDAMGPDRIVLVLMPVTSDLRSWLPAEALGAMRRLVEEVRVGRPVELIDLRDAMPDDLFADYAHLNPKGRAVFSQILAQRLNARNTEH